MTNNTWQITPIGEQIELLTDYTANGSFAGLKQNVQYYNQSNYAALVRTTDLEKKVFAPERFTDKKGYDFLKKSSLTGGEIVLANVGSIGKVYRVPQYHLPMTLAPNMYLIRFKESIDKNYAFQYLTSQIFQKKLLSNVASTTLSAINKSNLRSITIPVPPLEVQHRIGDILSSIDEAIQKTEQIVQKKQELKRALLDQVTNNTTGDIICLGDVIKIKNGYAYSGKYMVDEETDTILLTPGNVEIGGGFNFSKLRYFSGEVIRDFKLKHGDIFVALTDLTPQANFLGYPAIVPDLKKTFLHNQRLGLIEATSNKVDIKYIYFLLMTFAYRQHVISTATGTTVKHTSVSKIIDFEFKLPTLDEQKRIAQRIEKIEQDLNLEKKSKDLFLKLKVGLMHDIFNQKVQIN